MINLSGLALDFHPGSERRAHVQALVAHLLGINPTTSRRPAEIHDATFRPGNFRQPEALSLDASIDGSGLLRDSSHHLARLLAEIDARAPCLAVLIIAHQRQFPHVVPRQLLLPLQ
ncbi:MAG: hypothetical protein QM760_03280 [Nibricoccus sp.]